MNDSLWSDDQPQSSGGSHDRSNSKAKSTTADADGVRQRLWVDGEASGMTFDPKKCKDTVRQGEVCSTGRTRSMARANCLRDSTTRWNQTWTRRPPRLRWIVFWQMELCETFIPRDGWYETLKSSKCASLGVNTNGWSSAKLSSPQELPTALDALWIFSRSNAVCQLSPWIARMLFIKFLNLTWW